MTDNDKHEIDLDVFFEDAIDPTPDLGDALMARILADAGEVSASRQVVPAPRQQKPKGWLRRLLEPVGGMQGMAAVGICTVLGLTIGYTGTDSLQSIPGIGDIVASVSGDPLDDFSYGNIDAFSDFMAEG